MSDVLQGGCRCGAISYDVHMPTPPRAYACHCLDCQTWTGGPFSLQCFLPEDALRVSGQPALFELVSPDGARVSRQRACARCFTRIYNTNSRRPGVAILRAGTLDRSDRIVIAAHIWTRRRLAGVILPDGVPQWPESAPEADLLAALSV